MTAKGSSMIRLKRMTGGARTLGVVPIVLLGPSAWLGYQSVAATGTVSASGVVSGAILLGARVVLAVRALFLRVNMTESDLVVVDWYRTRRFPLSDVLGVRPAAYNGILNAGDLDGSGSLIHVVEIMKADSDVAKRHVINCTISFPRATERKVRTIVEAARARSFNITGANPADWYPDVEIE